MKQIGKPLTLDILEPARQLDLALGHYMFPYEQGLYLPGSATPRIVFGKEYLLIDRRAIGGPTSRTLTGEAIYTMHPNELRGDIWYGGKLMVPAQTIPLLAKVPYIPHRSLLVVQRVLERTVNRHYFFSRGEIPADNIDILEDALISEFNFKETDKQAAEGIDRVIVMFEGIMQPLIDEVKVFMGNDIYCAHVVVSRWDVAYITKHEDQRIGDINALVSAIDSVSKAKSIDEREMDVLRHALSDIILNASAAAKGGHKLSIDFNIKVNKR